MKSRRVLYSGIVAVLTACVIGGLHLQQHAAMRTEAAGAAGKRPAGGWTLFGGVGPHQSQRAAPPLTVESLESARDFYASFLAARASGRPEMVYEAMNLLSGCADGEFKIFQLADLQSAATEVPAEFADVHRKSVVATEELNRRCRGFGVVRDKRALRKQLWQQAAAGDSPLSRILSNEGYAIAYSVAEKPELKQAIAEGLRSADRTTIERAVQSVPLTRQADSAMFAMMEASRNVFGANGWRQVDTEFRKLHACSLGACEVTDSITIPDSQRDSQEAKDYKELIQLYEKALVTADVDAIMDARPSRFAAKKENSQEGSEQ